MLLDGDSVLRAGNGVFDEDQARTGFWGARQCFGSSRDPIITNCYDHIRCL
jgi:hypothetical protein